MFEPGEYGATLRSCQLKSYWKSRILPQIKDYCYYPSVVNYIWCQTSSHHPFLDYLLKTKCPVVLYSFNKAYTVQQEKTAITNMLVMQMLILWDSIVSAIDAVWKFWEEKRNWKQFLLFMLLTFPGCLWSFSVS